MKIHPLATLVMFMLVCGSAAIANGQCTFTTAKKTMTLNGDCTTDTSIVVPNGLTLDGAGHTITAIDPIGGNFLGGIVKNGGAAANITNVTITTAGLVNFCDTSATNRLRGILFDGASGTITDTHILNIIHLGANCADTGHGIEVRNFGSSATTIRVRIDSNTIVGYQKAGIVVNGDADASITDNTVDGVAPDAIVARNGIQLGFGATGMVKRNTVSNNEYTGPESYSSAGVLLVAGPGFLGSPYSVGSQIDQNTISENDVGVWVVEADSSFNAPTTMTNVKVVNNTITKAGYTNPYQAGVSDFGNNDKIINNKISGAGYDPNISGRFFVDADPSFTNRAKVHANR